MRIIACLASTLDGKIASKAHPKDRFGSSADLEHLRTVRNQADAILSGGETFRKWANVRHGNQTDLIPLQCILTRSLDLPTDAALFKAAQANPDIPITVFSPETATPELRAHYPAHIEWVTLSSENSVPDILAYLEDKGIQTLLVEGGGHIMNLFLSNRAIQELYLTLCPLLLGGQDDPMLVTGPGFSVAEAPRTEVLSAQWVEQELYLHLKIRYPG